MKVYPSSLASEIEHGTTVSGPDWMREPEDRSSGAEGSHLTDIADHCVSIYTTAGAIYNGLAKMGQTTPVTVFWGELFEEVGKQREYWNRVMELLKTGTAKLELLDSSERILKHLAYVLSRITDLSASISGRDTLSDGFVKAHCLEVFLLHPTLLELNEMAASSVYRNLDDFDPARHLTKFFFGLDEYAHDLAASDGLKESLQRLWKYRTNLAQENRDDPVTGALNRKGLFREMARLSSLAQRNGYMIAVLMFQVENLEDCYRRRGCEDADQMLVEMMTVFKSIIRESDVVGRFDFSTFLVYFPQVKQQFLYDIAERLLDRASLAQRSGLSLSIFMGGSYGMLGGEKSRSLQTYIDSAEDCMWRARLSRKTRILIE